MFHNVGSSNITPKFNIMGRFKIVFLAASVLLLCVSTNAKYKFKSSLAVRESYQCVDHWSWMVKNLKESAEDCPSVSVQGHRGHKEDRAICKFYILLPLLEKEGKNAATVDLFAVFDGHGGTEVSETLQKILLDKLLVYTVMDAFHKVSDFDNQNDIIMTEEGVRSCFQPIKDEESLRKILKEGLLSTIEDIDTDFSVESLHNGSNAGSTASVVLRLNHKELLVANVGNSKVILCAGYAEELTSDYHPESDVPRVNGIQARSQVIGDASVKKFGVTVEPEMVGWRNITAKDRFLVVASTGIFESLTPENVCRLVEDANVEEIEGPYDDSPIIEWIALTHYVVSAARKKGSTEDLTAIVVPLAQAAYDAQVHNDEL